MVMLGLSFVNSDEAVRHLTLGVIYFHINDYLSYEKVADVFQIIQTEILQPYNNTKIIRVYETVPLLQETLAESAKVSIDLNLDYYGPEYSESILTEWDSQNLVFHLLYNDSRDNMVYVEQEGSLSILYNMLNESINGAEGM